MTTTAGRVDGVSKIAVLRANGLGDYLFIVPALDALRAAYPDAEIVVLGTPMHRSLLAGRPGPVDRVVVVPFAEGVRLGGPPDDAELSGFFSAMQRERFDLAIQLHGGGRFSNPFTARLGARLTVGIRDHDAPALDRWVRYVYWQREVMRNLEAVALVGAMPVSVEATLAVVDDDRTAAADVLAAVGIEASAAVAVLNVGATDARRRWPADRLATVGDVLAGAGMAVVVSGDDSEAEAAGEVVARMHKPGVSVAGRLSLPALVGLVHRAVVVVSNDSGPLHLAAAVGTPTVGIYWCGNVVNGGPMATHRNRVTISWTVACPVCGVENTRDRCPHDPSFVEGVSVDDVLSEINDILPLTGAEV